MYIINNSQHTVFYILCTEFKFDITKVNRFYTNKKETKTHEKNMPMFRGKYEICSCLWRIKSRPIKSLSNVTLRWITNIQLKYTYYIAFIK